MASIDLHLHEVENSWMPPVCALCGRKGHHFRTKTVGWSPWWMPLLVMMTGFIMLVPFVRHLFLFAVLGADADRRVTLHLPFCKRHRNHWRWRAWPLTAVLVMSLCLIGGGIALSVLETQLGELTRMAPLLISASGVLGLVFGMILAAVLPLTAIRIKSLAGTALTLTGVHEKFCDAVAERRGQSNRAAFETSDYDEMLRRRRERRFD